MSLQDALDAMARSARRRTKAEAHRDLMCVRCSEEVDFRAMTEIDLKEYRISGVCPKCFADLFPPDDCE